MNWYEYDEDERKKEIYNKYTVKEFWDWWSRGTDVVMEVRIKDINIIKSISDKYGLPMSASGVYVDNYQLLKTVIGACRHDTTIWFGINPKKKNWNKWGKKVFAGLDVNISSIDYLFIDIDRIKKEGAATKKELENADIVAEKVLERLTIEGWNKSYVKICSGNGVQLLIKLDIPIKMPEVEFQKESGGYVLTDRFKKMQKLIREGIGRDLVKYCHNFRKEYGIEIDKSVFNIGRVGALLHTKNYKYGGHQWRGIVDIKDGSNDGLSDYILSKEDNIRTYQEKSMFIKHYSVSPEDRIKHGKLAEHPLVKFMLDNEFPKGGINNSLWFQLKCLMRDSNVQYNTKEFINVHGQLKRKHNRTFTMNVPDKRYTFSRSTINNFCIENGYPSIYEKPWPQRNQKVNMLAEHVKWEQLEFLKPMELDGDSIREDLKKCRKLLREGDLGNIDILGSFLLGVVKRYDEERAKGLYMYWLIPYFNFEVKK